MHFDILVEDLSGSKALEIIVPKIAKNGHTFNIKSYKGIGHLPKKTSVSEVKNRALLNNLPKLIQGFGKTHAGYPPDYKAALIIICDLDKKCLKDFRSQLDTLLSNCEPKPETRFCIAVQEVEAWYLGDIKAVQSAYNSANMRAIPSNYDESSHGTWELLADIIYKGGSAALAAKSWWEIGEEKSKWALCICPFLDIQNNNSQSFKYFRDKLLDLAEQ